MPKSSAPVANKDIDMTAALLAVLDNEDVVAKLGEDLSVSIHLILEEKFNTITEKLDKIIQDNKAFAIRITEVEKQNNKLKQENMKMYDEIKTMEIKVNALEQNSRKNNVIINGISETYAERAIPAHEGDGETPPPPTREDTVASVCAVINEACNLSLSSSDIQTAYRMKSRRAGPRPVLVSFHTQDVKQRVVKSRRPKQTLKFRGSSIYINDHLTDFNSELYRLSRDQVKQHEAVAAWTRDGQIFIKWSADSRSERIYSPDNLFY